MNSKIRLRRYSIFLVIIFIAFSCSKQYSVKQTPNTTRFQLTPFLTQTKKNITQRSGNNSTQTPPIASLPSLTPTPYIYTIVEGDTFTSIGFRHGVKLNDLITSNPKIDPNFLTIGMTITIPITNSNSILELNPTPIPLVTETPICYQNKAGGVWCVAQIGNTQPYDVENISAEFILTSTQKDIKDSQIVYSPLYVLPSGLSIPMMVYFPPPNPAGFQADIKILSEIPKSSEMGRYLTPIIENLTIQISNTSLSAVVDGNVSIRENQDTRQIWILAVAYSQEGIPVGLRKWETSSTLPGGDKISFRFYVYSLGPQINSVEVQVEAHP